MLILGIDPGSLVTGFGLIELTPSGLRHITHGILKLKSLPSFEFRLKELGLGMEELLNKYQPGQVAIEKIFLGKNADSAFKLGHARGVLMFQASVRGLPITEYATRLIKKGVTGNGAADKMDVARALQSILGKKIEGALDASDALAVATYHAFYLQNQARHMKAMDL